MAECYTELLKDVVPTPAVPEGFYSSWAQYTIRFSDEAERVMVQDALKSAGIPTMIYYPKAMSAQQAFAEDKQYIDNLNTRELIYLRHNSCHGGTLPMLSPKIPRICLHDICRQYHSN